MAETTKKIIDQELETLKELVTNQDANGSKKGRLDAYVLTGFDGEKMLDENGDEQTFIFKFPGMRKYIELMNIEDTPKQIDAMLKASVVYPKRVDLDYFDEHEGYAQVKEALDTFLFGLYAGVKPEEQSVQGDAEEIR